MRGVFVCLCLKMSALSAAGWVKSEDQYYGKLYLQDIPAHLKASQESQGLDESVRTLGYYFEYGFDFYWPTQVSVSGAQKTVVRQSNAYADQFSSSSVTDMEVVVKQGLWNGQVLGDVAVAVALDLGFYFPLTPNKYRVGKESERSSELGDNPSRSFLISGIDYGRSGSSQGLGVSLAWQGLWLNLAQSFKSFDKLSNGLSSASADSFVSLGGGLPMNSWVQISGQTNRSFSFEQSASGSTLNSYTASFGYTFYSGFALEGGYSSHQASGSKDPEYAEYTLGLSARSI